MFVGYSSPYDVLSGPETLLVAYNSWDWPPTNVKMLPEILNKRWQTVDVKSMMSELQRSSSRFIVTKELCHLSIVLSEKKAPACHKRIGISSASLFSLTLVKNISRKVVSMPFDFSKGIHLAVVILCEAEVLSSGFHMRTEI